MDKVGEESSIDLASRYRRELQELIDLGEVSPPIARRVLEDLLEPEVPGKRRRVRLAIWLDHITEAEAEAADRSGSRAFVGKGKQIFQGIRSLLR